MSAPENPQAYPTIGRVWEVPPLHKGGPGGYVMAAEGGMTLRDWFAGQVLAAVVEGMQSSNIGAHEVSGGGPSGFAATAYDIADAMLAERGKGGR